MSYKDKTILSVCQPDGRLDKIKSNPDMQLEVIKHFYPQVDTKKKFKLHEEKTPSSSLKLDCGVYWIKNFGSDEKAKDWLNVAESELNLSTKEALDYIYNHIVNQPVRTIGSGQFSAFEKRLFAIKQNSKTEAEIYLHNRGIEASQLPKDAFFQSNNIDGSFRGVVFIDSENRLINTRNISNSEIAYHNDGILNNSLFDVLYDPNQETVFLVEGCINALSICNYSVLAFFSASNYYTDVNKLKRYIQNKHVILAFDNDKAGNKFKESILRLLVEFDITVKPIQQLVFPEKVDINDLLVKGCLDEYIENAENYKQLYPRLLENSCDEKKDLETLGFFRRNHSYWVGARSKAKMKEVCISNFLMEILYFFPDGSDNAKRIFYLQNKHGQTEILSINSKSLTLDAFKYTIRSKGGFSFTGSTYDLDLILEDLFQKEIRADEVSVLGYQPENGVYAFSNGVYCNSSFTKINKFGIVEALGYSMYLPAYSVLNKYSNAFNEEQKFIYRKGKIGFEEWTNLFCNAFDEKGCVGVMYLIAAVFRDLIFRELEFFPHLFLFGDYGVGKTSYAEILTSVFYKNYKGISLEANSTSKAIARSAHKVRNALIYLKEYDSKIDKSIVGLLKTGYEGVGYTRAQTSNDNKTHDTNINSAIILDGNTLPSNSSAQFSRMVVLDFRQRKFTQQQIEAFEQLRSQSDNGFGKVLTAIIESRHLFENRFGSTFKDIYHELKYNTDGFQNMSDRSLKHLVLFLAIYRTVGNSLKLPFQYADLFNIIKNIIQEQDSDLASLNRLSQFWEAVDYLKSKGIIKNGIHYKYATNSEGKEFLAMKLRHIHKIYKDNAHIIEGEIISLADLERLIKTDPALIPSWSPTRGDTVNVSRFSSAYPFDIDKINLNIDQWER